MKFGAPYTLQQNFPLPSFAKLVVVCHALATYSDTESYFSHLLTHFWRLDLHSADQLALSFFSCY